MRHGDTFQLPSFNEDDTMDTWVVTDDESITPNSVITAARVVKFGMLTDERKFHLSTLQEYIDELRSAGDGVEP